MIKLGEMNSFKHINVKCFLNCELIKKICFTYINIWMHNGPLSLKMES